MKRSIYLRLGLVLFFACLSVSVIWSQEHSQASAPAQTADQKAQQEPAKQPGNPNSAISNDLTKASEHAVKSEEGEGEAHDENAKFKYSAMVAKLGGLIGLGPTGMYWVSLIANFVFLGLFFWMLLRSKLPSLPVTA